MSDKKAHLRRSHKSIVDLDACIGDELYKLQVLTSCLSEHVL